MFKFFAAIVVIWVLTFLSLRGGWKLERGFKFPEVSGEAIGAAVLSIAAAVYFIGPMGGLALIVSVVVHEFGHVAAYRVCGHTDARFRLVPLFGGVAISDQIPYSQARDYYITAMGPGICLALMLASMFLEDVFVEVNYDIYVFFWYLTGITAAMNFFNLLPLWPLDGGRMTRIITNAFSPALAHYVTLTMSAALVVIGLSTQSLMITAFAIMSAGSAFNAPLLSSVQRPVTRRQAILCLLLHLTMAGSFLLGASNFLALFYPALSVDQLF